MGLSGFSQKQWQYHDNGLHDSLRDSQECTNVLVDLYTITLWLTGAHDQPTPLLLLHLFHLHGSLALPRSTQSRHAGLDLSVTLVSQQESTIDWQELSYYLVDWSVMNLWHVVPALIHSDI
jgi:hypothetical protein